MTSALEKRENFMTREKNQFFEDYKGEHGIRQVEPLSDDSDESKSRRLEKEQEMYRLWNIRKLTLETDAKLAYPIVVS